MEECSLVFRPALDKAFNVFLFNFGTRPTLSLTSMPFKFSSEIRRFPPYYFPIWSRHVSKTPFSCRPLFLERPTPFTSSQRAFFHFPLRTPRDSTPQSLSPFALCITPPLLFFFLSGRPNNSCFPNAANGFFQVFRLFWPNFPSSSLLISNQSPLSVFFRAG